MKKTSEDLKNNFSRTLLKLARMTAIDEGELDICYKEICISVLKTLNADRCSIWFYNEDESAIECTNLWDKTTHSSGHVLKAHVFPKYFNYLHEERTLPAHDVYQEPATSEFIEPYLKPLNIKSMLDAPIRVGGKMVGVICCETVLNHKKWTTSDEIFIGNITDILARAIQAKERLEAMEALQILVAERTEQLEEQKIKNFVASKMATLGEMASGIAHEINNPLAIILGFLSMLKKMEEDPDVTSEEKNKILNDIRETTLRIDKIVRGLKFFARDGSMDEFVPTSLNQVVEDTLTLCKQKFYQKGCKVHINIPKENLIIKCQPISISQALLNLLGNAFDAIENNPVKWIKIDGVEKNGYVLIQITDSGSGINSNLHDKIMVPFFTTKPVGKGTGLGLPIVKGIMEQHKGTLSLDKSSANTSFIMSFPKEAG